MHRAVVQGVAFVEFDIMLCAPIGHAERRNAQCLGDDSDRREWQRSERPVAKEKFPNELPKDPAHPVASKFMD